MNIILELPIDNNYSIVVMSKYNTDVNVMYGYSGELFITLKQDTLYQKISSTITLRDLENMLYHFKAVSKKTLLIPLEISNSHELGLSYHTYWNQVSSQLGQNLPQWIGNDLKLLECNGKGLKSCLTFLYNEKNGDITFVITSQYPWFFPLTKIPMHYKTWLKHYKIIHQLKISHSTMRMWIQKLQPLCTLLRKNVDEMYSSYALRLSQPEK